MIDWLDWIGPWSKPYSAGSRIGNSWVLPHWEPIYFFGIYRKGERLNDGPKEFRSDVFTFDPETSLRSKGFGFRERNATENGLDHPTPKPLDLFVELWFGFSVGRRKSSVTRSLGAALHWRRRSTCTERPSASRSRSATAKSRPSASAEMYSSSTSATAWGCRPRGRLGGRGHQTARGGGPVHDLPLILLAFAFVLSAIAAFVYSAAPPNPTPKGWGWFIAAALAFYFLEA